MDRSQKMARGSQWGRFTLWQAHLYVILGCFHCHNFYSSHLTEDEMTSGGIEESGKIHSSSALACLDQFSELWIFFSLFFFISPTIALNRRGVIAWETLENACSTPTAVTLPRRRPQSIRTSLAPKKHENRTFRTLLLHSPNCTHMAGQSIAWKRLGNAITL